MSYDGCHAEMMMKIVYVRHESGNVDIAVQCLTTYVGEVV